MFSYILFHMGVQKINGITPEILQVFFESNVRDLRNGTNYVIYGYDTLTFAHFLTL